MTRADPPGGLLWSSDLPNLLEIRRLKTPGIGNTHGSRIEQVELAGTWWNQAEQGGAGGRGGEADPFIVKSSWRLSWVEMAHSHEHQALSSGFDPHHL